MYRFLYLDGFRALLCIWVVLFHYTERYNQLYNDSFGFSFENGGAVGVAFFFAISGFVTVYTVRPVGGGNLLSWFFHKMKRLYPEYIISCIVTFILIKIFGLLGRDDINWIDLFKDSLMLPFISGNIEPAHWYVLALVKFYICFCFMMKFKLQEKRSFYILYIIIIYVALFCQRFNYFPLFPKFINIVLNNSLCPSLMLGILLYMAFRGGMYVMFYRISLVSVTLYLALTVHVFYVPLILLLLYLLLLQANHYMDCIRNILSVKILVFIGNVSYLWYLLHQNIGYILIREQINMGFFRNLIPYTTLLETFLLACIIHVLYIRIIKKQFCQSLKFNFIK